MNKGYDRQHIPLCNLSYTCWFQAQRLPYKLEVWADAKHQKGVCLALVECGDAFQFINNIIAEMRLKTTGRSGVGVRRRVKKTKPWLEANRRYMIDKLKRVAYVDV